MAKIETENSKEQQEMLIKNTIWTCEAFHFSTVYALQYINNGLLGYEKDRDGNYKIKDGQRIPITISRATYFRYKKLFTNIPQIYHDLNHMALQGYVKLMLGFKEELNTLHRMSAENLLALKKPLERQRII